MILSKTVRIRTRTIEIVNNTFAYGLRKQKTNFEITLTKLYF